MDSGKKKTLILTLGIAGGLILSGIIVFSFKLFLIVGVGKALKENADENKATDERMKISLENFEKRKAQFQMIQRMESSNECRFWRQQLDTNKKAISKIKQYCYYGPNHKELPHAHSDKIRKAGSQ